MPTSERKIAANRTNGRKSHGPIDTTLTRTNATKHGLLAEGVTELDDAEGYRTTLRDLINELNPFGTIETFLVRSAALEMVRCRRAARLEAEYITGVLNPVTRGPGLGLGEELLEGAILDPGLPAVMDSESARPLVCVFQRYGTTSAHGLFRMLHELERLQRMRRGENVQAPVTVDLNVHDDNAMGSETTLLRQSNALGSYEHGN